MNSPVCHRSHPAPILLLALSLAACTSAPPGGTPVGTVASAPTVAVAPTIDILPTASPAPTSTASIVATLPEPTTEGDSGNSASPPPPPGSATADLGAASVDDATAMIGRTVEGGAIGGTYRLAAMRSGEHEDSTRLVWEMAEATGTPRYTATEVEAADGGARIELVLRDVYAQDFAGSLSLPGITSHIVRAVAPLPVFDDATLAFAIDLVRPARFDVVIAANPVRIVVDVYHR